MKKRIIFFSMLFISMFLTMACSKKLTTYIEISYSEFNKKIENKESFSLFVGSSNCSHCDDYKITLNKLIKNHQIEVYYIDVAKLTNDELNKFKTVINFNGTPTTVFITEGSEKTVYNRIVGALSYSKVEDKFEKAGYIKGE